MYCHQHAYVTWIMDECQSVLVDQTRLPYGWDFSIDPLWVTGEESNHGHGHGHGSHSHYASAEVGDEPERPVAPEFSEDLEEHADDHIGHEHAEGEETAHGHAHTHSDHHDDGHSHEYAISDAKLKKVEEYC